MDIPVHNQPGFIEWIGAPTAAASASTNTKGAWIEGVTATATDYDGLIIAMQNSSTTVGVLIDIGIGAAGSEVVIVANIMNNTEARIAQWFQIPIQIPAGTRIAVRSQATTGATASVTNILGYRGSLWSLPAGGKIITLGAVTADSGGTEMDPGGTIDTYGSYTTLVASSTDDICAIRLVLGNIQNSGTTAQAFNFHVDIAVGAAASEVTVCGPIRFTSTATGCFGPMPDFWLPCSIPAGSRVSARTRSGINDATDRKYDLQLLALVV